MSHSSAWFDDVRQISASGSERNASRMSVCRWERTWRRQPPTSHASDRSTTQRWRPRRAEDPIPRPRSYTRATILATAMRLFLEHGYGRVTIADIAREAPTAVPTVYASTGGKSAILATLIDQAMRDPIVEATFAAIRESRTPHDAIRALAHGVRVDNQRYHDMIQVMVAAATLDETATATLVESDRRYQQ